MKKGTNKIIIDERRNFAQFMVLSPAVCYIQETLKCLRMKIARCVHFLVTSEFEDNRGPSLVSLSLSPDQVLTELSGHKVKKYFHTLIYDR